jgi:excisionase family DNA binding protein
MSELVVLSLEQAARRVNVHPQTLRRLIENGDGPRAMFVGRQIRIKTEHFDEWLEHISAPASAHPPT